jgi:hypothetical protein
MVGNVTERFAVSKIGAQEFDMERFNLSKLSELEVRERYQIKTSNRLNDIEGTIGA